MQDWRDGRVKLALIRRALALRLACAALNARASILPLKVQGEQAGRVIAFAPACGQRVRHRGRDPARGALLAEGRRLCRWSLPDRWGERR